MITWILIFLLLMVIHVSKRTWLMLCVNHPPYRTHLKIRVSLYSISYTCFNLRCIVFCFLIFLNAVVVVKVIFLCFDYMIFVLRQFYFTKLLPFLYNLFYSLLFSLLICWSWLFLIVFLIYFNWSYCRYRCRFLSQY